MDSISIQLVPGAVPQAPTTVAQKPAVEPTAKRAEEPAATADTNADNPPVRDSRSVQYMVQGNRVITTIVDDQSKKVVVQIPDAELIRIAKSIDRMQGFFIEQKA